MRTTRLYVPQPLQRGALVTLDSAASRYVLQVLRLKAGAALLVFNGEGGEYEATVETAARDGARLRIAGFSARDAESPLSITLAQGIARGERMDYTLQKAVELGVAAIVPLLTEFCQVRLAGERLERRMQHWQGIVAAACGQCGRTRLPGIAPPVELRAWLGGKAGADARLRLILDPRAPRTLTGLSAAPAGVTLLVGPEGGLSATEHEAAQAAGFIPVRLGPRVLRTETAGVAALAALQTLWGDMG